MKYYLAPLEGITNVYYRKTHNKYYHGIDKYFIPFLNPSSFTITNKEKREINPISNNLAHTKVVPQIISKSSKDTIWLINELIKLGYDEVNLNFGCPSGTVVSKGRGAGMLKDLNYLDNYLNEVFSSTNIKISIKLRLGLQDVNEFNNILNILNKYNLEELIIRPRTSKEKYVGPIHLDALDNLNLKTNFDIIYNGEIKTLNDINYIKERFPFIKGIMMGRGLIASPSLVDFSLKEEDKLNTLMSFYNELASIYLEKFDWNNTKFFLKEIWVCLVNYFDIPKDLKKKLFKSEKEDEFTNNVNIIFSTCPINNNVENGIIVL